VPSVESISLNGCAYVDNPTTSKLYDNFPLNEIVNVSVRAYSELGVSDSAYMQTTPGKIVFPTVSAPVGIIYAVEGETLVIDCSIPTDTNPAATWSWKMGGSILEGETRADLVVKDYNVGVDKDYECEATSVLGSDSSGPIIVQYWRVPIPEASGPYSQILDPGQILHLSCNCPCTPIAVISWTFNGEPVGTSVNVVHENDGSILTVQSVNSSHAGNYKCLASSEAGDGSSPETFVVHINTPPTITLDPIAVILDPRRSMSCVCFV
jgi:hypothetical protein